MTQEINWKEFLPAGTYAIFVGNQHVADVPANGKMRVPAGEVLRALRQMPAPMDVSSLVSNALRRHYEALESWLRTVVDDPATVHLLRYVGGAGPRYCVVPLADMERIETQGLPWEQAKAQYPCLELTLTP